MFYESLGQKDGLKRKEQQIKDDNLYQLLIYDLESGE